MKIKIFKLEASAEIDEICCNLYDATLNVTVCDDRHLQVTLPDSKNVNVAVGAKQLIINQSKRLIPIGRQVITIAIPTHVVPNLSVTGNRTAVSFDGGIFGDLSLNSVCGELKTANCSFASVQITSKELNVHFNETTVKQNLFMQIKKGQLIAENSFAQVADCHIKSGNMGLINLSGSDFTFETTKGNVSLTLADCEEDYNTLVRVKNGTSNKPSTQNEGAQKSVKTFTESGNVVIDFVGERMVFEAATADDTQNDNDADGAKENTL
ncbi:MAG: DUF4097 family beta strand repeat-containing protein [Candidatus Coproplasma sp.]